MASVDILHPLADDTVTRTDVRVMVAYDLRSRKSKEKRVKLVCKMKGPEEQSRDTDVDPSLPGDHTFSFGTLMRGDYTASSDALSVSDSEDPIHLVDSTEPVVTIDPPAVPPPAIIPTAGSYANFTPSDFEVRVYGLVPESRTLLSWLLFPWHLVKRLLRIGWSATSRSKKPFDGKFKAISAWTRVTGIAGGRWNQSVSRETHDKHLMIRAKVKVGKKEQSSRGTRMQ